MSQKKNQKLALECTVKKSNKTLHLHAIFICQTLLSASVTSVSYQNHLKKLKEQI